MLLDDFPVIGGSLWLWRKARGVHIRHYGILGKMLYSLCGVRPLLRPSLVLRIVHVKYSE